MDIPDDFQYEVAFIAEVEEMHDEASHAGDGDKSEKAPAENKGANVQGGGDGGGDGTTTVVDVEDTAHHDPSIQID